VTRDPLDRYYTPDRLARAVVAYLRRHHWSRRTPLLDVLRVVEPSVGSGAWVRALRDVEACHVTGYDLDGAATGLAECDVAHVDDWATAPLTERWDWAIGNPPYKDATAHIARALKTADNVAMLVRATWLHAQSRALLLSAHRPCAILAVRGRPSFTAGGTDTSDYVVVVWRDEWRGPTTFDWLDWRGA
jgi:hypothetical protein